MVITIKARHIIQIIIKIAPALAIIYQIFISLNFLILITPDTLLYKIINHDKYYWDKKNLTIDHFRGAVEDDSEHTAMVFPSLVGKISRVYNFPSAIILTADMNAESWIKKEKFRKDEEGQKALKNLLLHEKKHLDLTEIYCRKAKDSIKSLQFPSYSEKYKIVEHFFSVSDSINDRFDLETGNGINRQQTILWNERIDKELNDQ